MESIHLGSLERLISLGRPQTTLNLRAWADAPYAWLAKRWPSLDMALFGLALSLYAITRLVGLENFPIYFFTDEAIQPQLAADLVHNGFRDSMGRYLPLYFDNNGAFYPTVSVYAHVVTYLLFGLSIFVTRATSVLITFFGMVAVGLILRDFLKIRFWWAGVLLLSITPVWFLHTRTAFQDVVGPSFYAWFLYFYLKYRQQRPLFLFPAILFGALAFYGHPSMHIIVVATGLLLLLSDFRHHWRNWRIGGLAVLFIIVLAVPFIRFQLDHSDQAVDYLRVRDSYWLRDIPLTEKLQQFSQEYTLGLNPAYWYDPEDSHDLIRHRMKDYGKILPVTLPFAALGLALCLRHIRSSTHRAVLIAILAAPTSGALVAMGTLRAVVIVIPVALLTAIGLAAVLELLTKRVAYRPLAILVFAVLSIGNLAMLGDALANGPTWYKNYGLYGMQYGAKQVFGDIKEVLQDSPQTEVLVSPAWTNGFDTVLRFFLPNEPRVRTGIIDAFNRTRFDLNDNMLFVIPHDEYGVLVDNPKFTNIRVEKIIKYPDGTDGFFFVRLNYSPEADAIIAAEVAARRQPVQEDFILDGQTISSVHSRFDMGTMAAMFDGDIATLARTAEANPALIELTFPEPRPLSGLAVFTGLTNMTLTATIFGDEAAEPVVYSETFQNLPPDRTVELNFASPPKPTKKIRIEVTNLNAPAFDHIHIRELVLR